MLAFAGLAASASSIAPAQIVPTPSPKISAPPVGEKGFPFLAEGADMAKSPGYVEKEVFIEGVARSYVPVRPFSEIADGKWDSTPTGITAPYKTRLLIRMPSNPAKFNGTVVLDWMNVSAGFDIDGYMGARSLVVKEGYAFVSVSAQASGAAFLPKWDAVRYGTIVHPGDAFSYDVFSQAAQAVRKPAADEEPPLGALTARIKNIIAVGGSQSGARLFTYIDAIQPTVGLIDGFMPTVASNGSGLSQAAAPTPRPAAAIRQDGPPVLWINSETELQAAARGLHLQPDGPKFRYWEIAGTAHPMGPPSSSFGAKLQRMGVVPAGQTGAALAPESVAAPEPNDVDAQPVTRAGLAAVKRWIETGKAPPSAPRLDVIIPADPSQPALIVRDPARGLARGGLRMPDIVVPTRTAWGERIGGSTGLNGGVDQWNGDKDPWDKSPTDISPNPEPDLAKLYPSHADYVRKVTAAANDLVAKGFVLRPDADLIVLKADAAKIGK